jgi:hypothetical protein
MVDARLHDADVVAHDEQDVGLLRLLRRGRRQTRQADADRERDRGGERSFR